MNNEFQIKKIIQEKLRLRENQSDGLFDEVIELIRNRTRQMSDDDAYNFHEKLKKWTNSLI